mgnify:CR=1 FL=1
MIKKCMLVVICLIFLLNMNVLAAGDGVFKIGVILYSYTDIQGQQLKSYGRYLEDHFNVEFNYVSPASTDDASHITTLENLLATGVDAVISGYETSLENSIKLCSENGVYYAVTLAEATQDLEKVSGNPYFLGGVKQFGDNPAEMGAKYAEAVYQAGIKNIGISSFTPALFLDAPAIMEGFISRLAELYVDQDYQVYEPVYHFFDPAQISNTVTTYINQNPEMEAIYALGSGMDFVYPALINNNLIDRVNLLALGYNRAAGPGIKNGTIVMAGTSNITQAMANSFALIYDKLNGYSYDDWQVNASIDYPTFSTIEELIDFEKYVIGDKEEGSVTAAELKSVMRTYNQKASFSDLQKLVNRSLEEIKAERITN